VTRGTMSMTLSERIRRGEIAVAKAKATGRWDLAGWERRLEELKRQMREAATATVATIEGEKAGSVAEVARVAVAKEPRIDPTEGRIVAVLIESSVLGADIWLAFDESFDAGDGLAVFYADELEFLKNKNAQTLREIHETKLAFGAGSRVRQ
jgi:hypothetical protein